MFIERHEARRRRRARVKKRLTWVLGSGVVIVVAAFTAVALRGLSEDEADDGSVVASVTAPAAPADDVGAVVERARADASGAAAETAPAPADGAPEAAGADAESGGEVPVAAGPFPPVDASDFVVGVEPVSADWRVPKPDAVRGIYLNVWATASTRKRARLLALADSTEINTFVVDVKDATGRVSFPSTVPFIREIGADGERRIRDIRAVLEQLKAHGVYPIARIVVFKDPYLAHRRPDWAIQKEDGSIWRDHHDEIWVDPYNRNVWDYNIALAKEAIALGFSEVQWDYVRFPDVPRRYMESAVFPAREGRTREQAIREFLEYSQDQLEETGVPVTADVFGLTVSVGNDMGIGQSWDKMVDVVDVLLPMVYPSHFARGSYGIAHPNASPYRTILTAMEHAVRRTEGVEDPAGIRPWLQDFSLGEPSYGPAEVRAQIQAVYDAGLEEWVLWNSRSDYTAAALAPEGGEPPEFPIPDYGDELPVVLDSIPQPDVDLIIVPDPTGTGRDTLELIGEPRTGGGSR